MDFRTEYIWDHESRIFRWGKGPWVDEPDVCEWHAHGIRCFMRRHPEWGSWLGYIALLKSHPWYGQRPEYPEAAVHGDMTFAGPSAQLILLGPEEPYPARGEGGFSRSFNPLPVELDELWWLGFDCGHGFDAIPLYDRLLPQIAGFNSIYRDFRFTRDQCENLALQASQKGFS